MQEHEYRANFPRVEKFQMAIFLGREGEN